MNIKVSEPDGFEDDDAEKRAADAAAEGEHDEDEGEGETGLTEEQIQANRDKSAESLRRADIETRARRQGWRPESEWKDGEGRRRPVRFKSAEEWLREAGESNPILRERNRHLTEQLEKTQRDVESMKGKVEESFSILEETRRMNREAVERARKKGREEARAEMEAAAAEGDVAKFKQAQKRVDEIDQQAEDDRAAEAERRTKAKKPGEDGEEEALKNLHPDTRAWIGDNKWFKTDPVLRGYMTEIHNEIRRERPDLSVREQLEEAERDVRQRFPERFGRNPRREGNGTVSIPSGHGNGRSRNGFDALPAEDRAAYERHRKWFKENRNVDYTKEEFMKEYARD